MPMALSPRSGILGVSYNQSLLNEKTSSEITRPFAKDEEFSDITPARDTTLTTMSLRSNQLILQAYIAE
jgi:hypothetical protein